MMTNDMRKAVADMLIQLQENTVSPQMTVEEAERILERWDRWCELAVKLSWKVALRDWMSRQRILSSFVYGVRGVYEERFPKERVSEAMLVMLAAPLRGLRSLYPSQIAYDLIKVQSMSEETVE